MGELSGGGGKAGDVLNRVRELESFQQKLGSGNCCMSHNQNNNLPLGVGFRNQREKKVAQTPSKRPWIGTLLLVEFEGFAHSKVGVHLLKPPENNNFSGIGSL